MRGGWGRGGREVVREREGGPTGQGRDPPVVVRDGGRGVRGGRRVDASPRTVTLVDHTFPRRSSSSSCEWQFAGTSKVCSTISLYAAIRPEPRSGGASPCNPSKKDNRMTERSIDKMPPDGFYPRQEGDAISYGTPMSPIPGGVGLLIFHPPERSSTTQVTQRRRINCSLHFKIYDYYSTNEVLHTFSIPFSAG